MESLYKRKLPTRGVPSTFHGEDEHMMPSIKTKSSSINKQGMGNFTSYDYSNEVDRRAAKFISFVQERLRLERIDDDWRQ
ncbi:hypothetical protein ZIOFF_039427 [Zingiber officinale]|uniref:Uncharacterized protein n=1 Tax=Zingiber officinale TaxID=94328 RepID=A0A8J5FTH3_ZINOF|nr:hypothetical protein ZIOFF_043536 [Zingiber officinale]KAG6499637.1 hypothetical protein ZIOFF_039427 [Zingiber officinale]